MQFNGVPLEYAEFVTNFRDNIESQVADESQGLTRLLAQCVGKGKDAIRIRKSPCRKVSTVFGTAWSLEMSDI